MPRTLKTVRLVVTGSIAAVKTFLLADALRGAGITPHFTVTPSAWPFLQTEGKYKATEEQLHQLKTCHPERSEGSSLSRQTPKILRCAQDDIQGYLIAPASADFIRQVAHGDTPLGAEIKNSGKPVIIAPAMNFMMWNHPAVQRNVRALIESGAHILGPAIGDMACGDTGYGRMLEPADIAAAARAILDGKENPYPPAGLSDNPRLPVTTHSPCRKILLADATPAQAKALIDAGHDVQCVGAPDDALQKLTGHPVVSDHYQLYPKDGMEHIWLPEDSDAVVIHLSKARAAGFAKGAAETFIACIYLASKRPILLIPAPDCNAGDIATLKSHGAIIADETELPAALGVIAKIPDTDFNGRHFIILNGSPRETVDSFRFYVNTARPEDHGRRVAAELAARGAAVTVIDATGNARDLVSACKKQDAEAVLQLANISQFTAPNPAAHKISKTGPDHAQLFAVAGNIDIIAALQEIFGADKVLGYNTHQDWADTAHTPLRHKIASLARRTR